MTRLQKYGTILLLIGGVTPAVKAGSLVTDRADLSGPGSSTIDWGAAGGQLAPITKATVFESSGPGLSFSTAVSGQGIRLDQFNPSTWNGLALANFAPGDHLYESIPRLSLFSYSPPKPITLSFSTGYDIGLRGVGTQIAAQAYGPFTAFLNAYDKSGNLLGEVQETGFSDYSSNNSAIFIGIRDNAPDIASVTIGLLDSGGHQLDAMFAINQVTLLDDLPLSAVPEPSTLLSGSIAGLFGLVLAYRRRASAPAAG